MLRLRNSLLDHLPCNKPVKFLELVLVLIVLLIIFRNIKIIVLLVINLRDSILESV